MQTHLTDIDDFPSRCDAWLACFLLLLTFVSIFLQCLMAYIKRFFGTVYFKRATCYLWRVERLCVYDQNANTTNLHSVILDDGIAKYFGLRLEYILGDTTRLTMFFWEMKTNIYFTYFWHMTHFIMIFPAMAWIDRRILRWKIAEMTLTKWIIFSVGIVWEKCIQCQRSSEKWRYFMNLNFLW